jgi:phosphate transport system substrate-binding protein
MKRKLSLVLVLFIATSLGIASCNSNTPTASIEEPGEISGQIQVAGSIKVQTLADTLGDAFTNVYPDVSISVQGTSSKAGVAAVGEGQVDIGLASRDIKDFEYEEYPRLVAHTVAFESIAIVTSPNITLNSLTIEQVKDVFAGDITNFLQVGGPDVPISLISDQEGSRARVTFQDLVMESGEIDKTITNTALIQGTEKQVLNALSSIPNSIGYLPIDLLDETTQPVPIDGVEPSVANIHNGSYQVFRPLNMITYSPPDGSIKLFLDWVKSEEGQAVVAEHYISILAQDE